MSFFMCNFSPSLTIESLALLPLTLERSLPSRVHSIYQSISAYTPSLYVCLSPSRVCARDHSRSRHLTRPLTPSSSASPSLTSIYQCTLVLRKLQSYHKRCMYDATSLRCTNCLVQRTSQYAHTSARTHTQTHAHTSPLCPRFLSLSLARARALALARGLALSSIT